MVRRIANLCLLSTVVLVLGNCSSSKKDEPEENVFPSSYKSEILVTMTTSLDDPTNVRGAYISEPVLQRAGNNERYVVCVRSDSRDANRLYTGSKDRIAIFYGGHLNQLVEATKEQCGNATYKPFPELEKLCQAKKCI
jgi:hypothetical protein